MISTASSASACRHSEELSIDKQLFIDINLAFSLSCYTLRNKEVSKFELYSSGVPSQEAVDELHN